MGTDHNVADVGTRADKVTINDIGPESRYENGDLWMRMDVKQVVESGVLKTADSLKAITGDAELDFKKGSCWKKSLKY